jgi:hypothetical protein
MAAPKPLRDKEGVFMKKPSYKVCLSSFDFFSYLSGTAYEHEKAAIEQHLSICEICFDTFISAFNQHLDHTNVQIEIRPNPAYAYQHA